MKLFFVTIIYCFIFQPFLIAQVEYNLGFNLSSVNYQEKVICYDIQIENSGNQQWELASQNFRVFYDASMICHIPDSLSSYLGQNYSEAVLVNDIKIDATGIGQLSYESSLAFLNFFIDLSVFPGVAIDPGETVIVSQLCFSVLDQSIDSICINMDFAQEGFTDPYAQAYTVISATDNTFMLIYLLILILKVHVSNL